MATAQAPQDAARKAAIAGEFGKVYDGRRLRDHDALFRLVEQGNSR